MSRDNREDVTKKTRRTFMVGTSVLVGAAGASAVVLSGSAAATLADGLDADSDDLQEALVVFEDENHVERLEELDLADGYYGYETFPIGYSRLTGNQLSTVADWEEVRRISPNSELEWEHDDARPDTRAAEVQAGEGLEGPYTGENVHVAVIDTGIDGAHPDLEENLEANWQWIDDAADDRFDEGRYVGLNLLAD